jgi:hypothetical protein
MLQVVCGVARARIGFNASAQRDSSSSGVFAERSIISFAPNAPLSVMWLRGHPEP